MTTKGNNSKTRNPLANSRVTIDDSSTNNNNSRRMLKEQEYMKCERNVKEDEPTPSTSSYRVGGTSTIDKFLKQKALSYLKGKQIKKEKVDVDDDDDDD